jgi:hypothetical protein
MIRSKTRREKHKRLTPRYNPVFNHRNERVRGLWERNGVLYAQVKVRSWTGRVPLHNSKTVSDAQAARQALKAEIKPGTTRNLAGTWKTPVERGREGSIGHFGSAFGFRASVVIRHSSLGIRRSPPFSPLTMAMLPQLR